MNTRPCDLIVMLGAVWACVAVPGRADDFALRDGATVVFLGDSITAARTYGKVIENYTLLRFPGRKVRFINAGHGGDTATGGLARLDRDVFERGATVLTVAYGINDIGWGAKADEEHRRQYVDSIRRIVERCRERGVDVYICSAPITAADPAKTENDFLQQMCDEGLAASRAFGGHAIDVQRGMRAIQKRVWSFNAEAKDAAAKESLHAPDGIHLNDLGQLAMAFAILKGLGAPADVSAVALDARDGVLLRAEGCTVTGLTRKNASLEFDRLDEGLPLNLDPLWGLAFRFIPIPEELNRYLLTVKNLAAGEYVVLADGRSLGNFTAQQLEAGVNLASATPDPWEPGGPWQAQAMVLNRLTEARDNVARARQLTDTYLRHDPHAADADAQADALLHDIEKLQHTVVQPHVFHFAIRPLEN